MLSWNEFCLEMDATNSGTNPSAIGTVGAEMSLHQAQSSSLLQNLGGTKASKVAPTTACPCWLRRLPEVFTKVYNVRTT